MTPPPNIEAACIGCSIYESPARGQRVCPALVRQIQEEAEARQQAALLRSMVAAEAPNSPPGLVELVRGEAVHPRTPLLLPPGPSTSSVLSDEGKEVDRVEVSRAVR
jgi:hypothetical protein